jgi:hypothetical protein
MVAHHFGRTWKNIVNGINPTRWDTSLVVSSFSVKHVRTNDYRSSMFVHIFFSVFIEFALSREFISIYFLIANGNYYAFFSHKVDEVIPTDKLSMKEPSHVFSFESSFSSNLLFALVISFPSKLHSPWTSSSPFSFSFMRNCSNLRRVPFTSKYYVY